MMVEAGGLRERSFQYYEEGAPKVTEEVLADGLEAAKTWIRESIVLQRQLVAAYVAARGPIEAIEYSDVRRLRRRRLGAGRGRRHRPASPRPTPIAPKAERNAALDEATTAIVEELAEEFPEPRAARSRRLCAA